MMCRDVEVARGVPRGVPVFGLEGTRIEEAAREGRGRVLHGDVRPVQYDADGLLVTDRVKK